MSNNSQELVKKVINLNNSLNQDMSDLADMLEKLNISLHKLNLEYQWMCQEKKEKGEV